MKMTLLTIGKTDRNWVRDGLEIYVSRLKHYVSFSLCEIQELKNVGAMSREQIKGKEGEMLLKAVRPCDELILLDERGAEYSSIGLARLIENKMATSGEDIVFAVGGAYGFSEAVYQRSNGKISLSKMTFSHQMARVIFAEQLYRAFTIIKGEPYHHE